MDKYKVNSAFNKWFSAINLKKLPLSIQEKISDFNHYQKKLTFTMVLKIFLHGIHEEKGSLREMDTTFVSTNLQKEIGLRNISYSQLSRKIVALDEDVLCAIFQKLLERFRAKTSPTKRNSGKQSLVSNYI